GTLVGSLLLGLFDDAGVLHHVGVTSSFTVAARRQLAEELEPLQRSALAKHPWRDWAGATDESVRMPGAQSRWSAGKDLAWEPVRRVRGEVRPPPGRALRARDVLRALASRQAAGSLSLRPARGHAPRRAREDLRRELMPATPRRREGCTRGGSAACLA